MLLEIYPIFQKAVVVLFLIFTAALILRLIFNFTDPNPFGTVGRFSYKLKKLTDRYVYPAARLLASFGIDTRYAPLVTMLVAGVLVYFALGIVHNTFYIIHNLTESIKNGNVKAFIGFILYGLLSVLILFIFIRFISAWFVFKRNTFLGFVQKVTDPILLPVQRLIPPIGMFDISAMVVLLLINFLQIIVVRFFELN